MKENIRLENIEFEKERIGIVKLGEENDRKSKVKIRKEEEVEIFELEKIEKMVSEN